MVFAPLKPGFLRASSLALMFGVLAFFSGCGDDETVEGGTTSGGRHATTGGAGPGTGGTTKATGGAAGAGEDPGGSAGVAGELGAAGAPTDSPGASGSGGESSGAEPALYVVSNTVYGPDTATSYLTVVDSLAPGLDFELTNSVEFPGNARAYGPEGESVVYVTSSEDGRLTEVAFDADGSPRLGRVVSFANLGISGTTGGNVHLFVSPEKAYFVSQESLEIVVWNPQEMEIVETIPLDLGLQASESISGFPS